MNWVLLNAVGGGSIAWFSFVSDDSNFILLNCTPFCTQFRGPDIALPRLLGVKNFYAVEIWEVYRKPTFLSPVGSWSIEKDFWLFWPFTQVS